MCARDVRTVFEHLPLLHEGVPHAVGLAAELQEPAVVGDAVDDRGGHPVVAEAEPQRLNPGLAVITTDCLS